MTRKEGIEAYLTSTPPSFILDYDGVRDEEEMLCVATGVVGALLALGLRSLSGPELGSPVPFLVCNVPGDHIRLFLAPLIQPYGKWVKVDQPYIKKAREFVQLAALSYQGDQIFLDTRRMQFTNYIALGAELQYQKELWDRITSVPRSPSSDSTLPSSVTG